LIADFGVSWIVDEIATGSGGTGTIFYAAPELYRDDVDCTTKCDVFSFGLVLYEILTKRPVFDPVELSFPIIRRLRARDFPEIPLEYGALMQNLITKCWENDPEDRPSFQEIFTWFQDAKFAILPSADAIEIGEFCTAVLEWEKAAGISL
jgi:serine/threonine protein kinase